MNAEIIIATNELIACYSRLGETRKKNFSCYCHDLFEHFEMSGWQPPQYAWQWNLSIDEYNNIKDLLKKHSAVLKNVICNNKTCCKLLQMYVSEWYKREYNGNDKQGNAFDSIEIDDLQEIVCKKLGVDESEVYHDSSDRCRWIDTIYVDGGLPLNYLLNSKNSAFRKTIEDVIESNAECVDYMSDELGDLCNNQVVNQSYKARTLSPGEKEASVYDFIQEYVVSGNLAIEGFEEFTRLIREKNDNALKKKFEVRYKVFKTDRSFQFVPQMFLKSEPNGVRYSISQERLAAWGIPSNDNKIHVKITSNDKLIWSKDFYKCLRGDYILSARNDLFDLWLDNNTRCLDKWEVFVGENKVTKLALKNTLEEHGYVQLYSVNGYSWSSQASNNYNYSAVLFDRNQENTLNNDETIITINGEQLPWGWKQIKDQLQFTISRTPVTLYEKAGIIEVKPKKQHELSKFLVNNPNSLVLLYENEKPSFEVVLTKKGIHGEPVPETIDRSQLQLKYRRGQENYSEWHDNDCFRAGYYQCKVALRSNEMLYKIINCFALPKQAEISNNPENKRTDFREFRDLVVSVNNEVLNDDNGVRRKFWQNKINYHNPYVTYTISDGNESFDITYPQPVEAIVLKRKSNGAIFDVASNNKGLRLPICDIDKLEAFKLPENNRKEILRFDKLQRAFLDLKEYRFNQTVNQVDIPYVAFRTFTHSEVKWKNGIPYLERGNLDFSDLTFVFSPISNPLELKPISLISDDEGGSFFEVNGLSEGIIMQQVGKYGIPKYFIRPFYVPNVKGVENLNEQQRRDRRLSRIDKCHNNYLGKNADRFDEALNYFEVASKTGNYFGSFDALIGLVCHYDENIKSYHESLVLSEHSAENLANFFRQYTEATENIDYTALWRMADEFLFDWMLIPRDIWKIEVRDSVEELLLSNPRRKYQHGYTDFINRFWEVQLPNKVSKNTNVVLRTILNDFTKGKGVNSSTQACFWNMDVSSRKFVLDELSNNDFFVNLRNN